jgi:CHASE2 domain-containing sensor protein
MKYVRSIGAGIVAVLLVFASIALLTRSSYSVALAVSLSIYSPLIPIGVFLLGFVFWLWREDRAESRRASRSSGVSTDT